MKVKVNSTHHDMERRSSHLIVYLEDNSLTKLADKWFTENNIVQMKCKSKAWAAIGKLLHGMISMAIHIKIDGGESCTFSHRAGCRCGCSPGYVIKNPPDTFRFCNSSVEISETEGEEVLLRNFIKSKKVADLLKRDWERHSVEVQ